jgi:dolichol-phosphate mannosyltransferase
LEFILRKLKLSYVIPAHNEQESINNICDEVVLNSPDQYKYEIIVVDDGSSDQTANFVKILHKKNPNIKLLALSRNFGKELATTAGIEHASGNAIIILDADGQHPPEYVPEFVKLWNDGAQIVVGVRKSNTNEGFVKRVGSKFFYFVLNKFAGVKMIPASTDFRLIDREVRDMFVEMRETSRITRGLIDWLGFDVKHVNFHAKARHSGEASYSTKKLVKLALNSVVSLSLLPLYISGYAGIIITGLSFTAGVVIIIQDYVLGDPLNWNITGSASLGILILFLVGIILISQGLLALYVSRIYEETRGRPLYVVNKSKSRL